MKAITAGVHPPPTSPRSLAGTSERTIVPIVSSTRSGPSSFGYTLVSRRNTSPAPGTARWFPYMKG